MFLRAIALSILAAVAAGEDEGPMSRVQYTEVLEHRVELEVELPGSVEAPQSSRVAAEVEGLVVELHAREGQHVKKGRPLLTLRTDALSLDLQRATAERAYSSHRERRIQSKLNSESGEAERSSKR